MPFLSEGSGREEVGWAGGVGVGGAGTGFLLFTESVYILSASQVSPQSKHKV